MNNSWCSLILFVGFLVASLLCIQNKSDYEKIRANRDSLAAAWLNCAEGRTQQVQIDGWDYKYVQCRPMDSWSGW